MRKLVTLTLLLCCLVLAKLVFVYGIAAQGNNRDIVWLNFGSATPSTCATGQVFVVISPGTAGLYECTAANTWTISPNAGITNSAGNNVVMKSNGPNAVGSGLTDNAVTISTGEVLMFTANGSAGAVSVGLGNSQTYGMYFGSGVGPIMAVNASDSTGFASNETRMLSTGRFTWCPSTTMNCTIDTGLSRVSAGVVAAGNGAQGDGSGTVRAATIQLTANISWTSGAGVPSAGSCTAANGGSLFSRTDGTPTTTLYVCDNSTHVWTAK